MNCVNHGSTRKLAGRFLGSKRMRMGGGYLILAKEYKQEVFVMEEAKLLDFLEY
jgi:hypothetical protein